MNFHFEWKYNVRINPRPQVHDCITWTWQGQRMTTYIQYIEAEKMHVSINHIINSNKEAMRSSKMGWDSREIFGGTNIWSEEQVSGNQWPRAPISIQRRVLLPPIINFTISWYTSLSSFLCLAFCKQLGVSCGTVSSMFNQSCFVMTYNNVWLRSVQNFHRDGGWRIVMSPPSW